MTTVSISNQSPSLVEFMSSAASHPDRPGAVHLIETHISWVFLTDRFAYKLKKPVRFEFLDFSTPELRHRACLEELRLNRRLAPDVYLAVLPITQDANGCCEFNGQGTEVDWVVQMRRLPAEQSLDVLLQNDRLSPAGADAIAEYLADFYAQLLPAPVTAETYRQTLDRHIRANASTLGEALPAERSRLQRIQTAQLRYLNVQSKLFDARVATGRVVEGHGDLRPEHIYLVGSPIVIDCVEFSEELRTVDIADELSFLAMECERLGNDGLGQHIIAWYKKVCKDDIPESLLHFYCMYRACVRAKVELLRDQQRSNNATGSRDAIIREYIDLADRYAARLGPPMLIVVGGLMGTGKSTLAAKLADAFAIERISTDQIRRALWGASKMPAEYGEGNYRSDMRSHVYDELFRQEGELLSKGQSAILDGTFLTTSLRERAYDLGNRNGAISLHVHCTCPRSTAYARIQQRAESGQSESEARTELYDLQAQDLEPPWSDEPAITVDTTQPLPQQLSALFAKLRPLVIARQN